MMSARDDVSKRHETHDVSIRQDGVSTIHDDVSNRLDEQTW